MPKLITLTVELAVEVMEALEWSIDEYDKQDDIDKANVTILEAGDNFHVYTGLRHRMEALEDTELFEFSTQHFDTDSYRIEKGD